MPKRKTVADFGDDAFSSAPEIPAEGGELILQAEALQSPMANGYVDNWGGRRTETQLILPKDTLEVRYWELGFALGQAGRAWRWWIGDFVLYGAETYGYHQRIICEKVAQVTGLDLHTVENLAAVAKAINPSIRRPDLSWAHHRVLPSGLPSADKVRLLNMAAEQGMTSDDLARFIRDEKRNAKTTDFVGGKFGTVGDAVEEEINRVRSADVDEDEDDDDDPYADDTSDTEDTFEDEFLEEYTDKTPPVTEMEIAALWAEMMHDFRLALIAESCWSSGLKAIAKGYDVDPTAELAEIIATKAKRLRANGFSLPDDLAAYVVDA